MLKLDFVKEMEAIPNRDTSDKSRGIWLIRPRVVAHREYPGELTGWYLPLN